MRSLLLPLLAAALVMTGACAANTTVSTGTPPVQANPLAPAEPGDRVVVRSRTRPEVSDTFAIDENGRLALPTLGFFPGTGMPAGRLQDSIRAAYGEILRDPALRVTVLRRVSVLGEVKEPGTYLADLTMGVSSVIALAGGLTEDGDPARIEVQRGDELISLSQRHRSEYSLAGLRSGDQIVVRTRGYWARNPGVVVSTLLSVLSVSAVLVSVLFGS